MKNRLATIALLTTALLAMNALAQPNTLWTQTFGTSQLDRGNSIQATSDGGYIITGTYEYNFWSWDSYLYLIKIDDAGNALWQSYVGGDNTYEGYSVQQTADGGYVIVGNTGYTYQFDVLLIKTDSFGNYLWTQLYGGDGYDTGRCVRQTPDGGYVIVGITNTNTAGASDVWLVKTDANGVEEWNQCYGDAGTDVGESVQLTSDGGYIIIGTSNSFSSGDDDVYVVKTDANGLEEWHQTIGGTSWDSGYDIQQTADGGYILTGLTTDYGDPAGDVYLVKLDASGAVEWIQHPGGAAADAGYCVQITSDGGYVVSGFTESYGAGMYDIYLVKTDMDGNQEWQATAGGGMYDEGYCVQQTADGGYIVTGYTESFGSGNQDLYVVRFDDGSTQPSVTVTLTPTNPPIQIPAGGGSFDFTIGVENSSSFQATFDVWTMATLPSGGEYGPIINVQDVTAPANWSTTRDRIQAVPANAPMGTYSYDAYVGHYPDDIWSEAHFDFEKLGSIDNNSPVNTWNNWGEPFTGEEQLTAQVIPADFEYISACPNPFNPTTTLSYKLQVAGHTTLTVFDVQGREVATLVDGYRNEGVHQVSFDGSGLASGVYIYTLTSGSLTASGKMVLMK